MKRFLILALLSALLLPARLASQIDIQITASGPIRNFFRNYKWNTAGQGGIANNFIFTPLYTNEGACFQLTNGDPTNTQQAIITFFGTADQTVATYENNTQAWSALGPTSNTPLYSAAANLAPQTSRTFFVQIAGQARVAVVFQLLSGTATATATLNLVETQLSNGCGNVSTTPVVCPYAGFVSILTGNTGSLVPAPSASQTTYICNLIVLSNGTATASATGIELGTETTANCAGSLNEVFQFPTTAAPVNINVSGQPLLGRFKANGNDLAGTLTCLTNNSGVTVQVNFTFAQY